MTMFKANSMAGLVFTEEQLKTYNKVKYIIYLEGNPVPPDIAHDLMQIVNDLRARIYNASSALNGKNT